MRLTTAIAAALGCVPLFGGGSALASQRDASVARACQRVEVKGGFKAKVHVDGRATCNEGRRVARRFYKRVGGPWDGKTGDGRIYYRILGYKCTTGLGGSEGFCSKPHRSVEVSTR